MGRLLGAIAFVISLHASASAATLGCEGDSQTASRASVSDAQTWCALVAEKLGWSHINFAVGGSTTRDVINRLPADLATAGCCDCIVIQIGANDSFIPADTTVAYPPRWSAPINPPAPGVSLNEFISNLRTIATEIRSHNIPGTATAIPITFMTQWAFFSTPELVQEQFYVDGMKDVGGSLGIPVIDAFSLQLGGVWWNYQNDKNSFWSTYEVDYQHPSSAGHAWQAAQFSRPAYAASCAHHP